MNLQRLLVNRIEQRIIVGTVAFLATLVLVGWIAINEGGRMAAFDKEFAGRSIEGGAMLFASNCSTCHGADGRGSPKAPALNSPLLFGYDYLADIHKQREALTSEQGLQTTTQARKDEITTALADLDTQETAQKASLQTAIDKGYDPDHFNRLLNLDWSGSLHNYIYSTVFSGRPNSKTYWPNPMPNWAQPTGGPLRTDQVEDLTQFVMNFDKGDGWTTDDLLAVNQFPKAAADPADLASLQLQIKQLQQSGGVLPVYVGIDTPIADIMKGLEGITGDPQHGNALYMGQTDEKLPCSSCHVVGAGTIAPPMVGTWTRVQDIRLKDPKFAGWTGEQYIADSIIHPSDYLVPPYADGMIKNFGEKLTYQNLADLIAYLKTQDQTS
ncbi:MAG: c-type cytochrome [Chloroflexota bacterium]